MPRSSTPISIATARYRHRWEATPNRAAIGVPVIASGGIASIDDIEALAARTGDGIAGAICGRAFYDGRLDPRAALRIAAGPAPS